MLGIQNQPQIGQNNSLSFQSRHNDRTYVNYDDDEDFDSFDRKEEAKADRDSAKRKVADDKAEWDNLADELENSDSKVSKKLGKGARFMASAVGLAGTFLVAKCSSKLTIETLKSFAKSKTMASTLETFKSVKAPLESGLKSVKQFATEAMEKPAVQEQIAKLKNSKVGKTVDGFLKNEKVKKVTEPLRNTISQLKDIKIDGKKVQNAAENTMAVTTTGSVLVDNLTGRNNDKSAIELATGSSGEV